jgi:hypothetical protein
MSVRKLLHLFIISQGYVKMWQSACIVYSRQLNKLFELKRC